MKFNRTLFFAVILLASCDNQQKNNFDNQKNLKVVLSEDPQMNFAIKNAKETFEQFDTAFKNGNFDTTQFSLKVRFETETGGEHIWTYGLTFKDNSYYGIVDDDAVATTKIKKGDKVKITMDNLSDWMYSDDGILRGGFTLRALRKKMNKDEKKAFDSSFYLQIID